MLPSLKTYHSLDTRACSPQAEPTKASWPGLLPSASGPSTWRDPAFYWTLCWCLNRKYSLTCFLECSPLQISKALSFLLMFPNHLLWLVPEGLHHPVHTCAHAHTHTHTHTRVHIHTHTFQSGIGCCPSAHSHNNVIFNKHLLPSLHSVFLEYKHYILFIWASPEPSTVPGREHAGNKCQMKPYMNKSIMILQRQLGGIWKGHIFIKNKP